MGTKGPMRLPNWWASSPPMATTRRVWQRASQLRMLCSGGWSSTRPGVATNRTMSAMLPAASPVSLTKLHSSTPWSASQSRSSNGMPGARSRKRSEPREKGVGGDATPAGIGDRAADAGGVEPLVADDPVDPEGEVVVAPPRRDLGAHEHQDI